MGSSDLPDFCWGFVVNRTVAYVDDEAEELRGTHLFQHDGCTIKVSVKQSLQWGCWVTGSRRREDHKSVVDISLQEDVVAGEPLSVNTLPKNFVPRDANVTENWAQLRANRCSVDLAKNESPHLDVHALEAGFDYIQDVLHINDPRSRRASVGLLTRKNPVVVDRRLSFHRKDETRMLSPVLC